MNPLRLGWAGLGVLWGLCAASPPEARAQIHGAWLPPPGTLELRVLGVYARTDSWFCGAYRSTCEPGDRVPISDFVGREESRTASLFGSLAYTPFRQGSVFLRLPFHALRYESFSTGGQDLLDVSSTGVGDLAIGGRIGEVFMHWAVSGGYMIELPTGAFDSSTLAFAIPLGQGTRNHHLFLELGRSLHPHPGYVQAGILARLREPVEDEFGVTFDWGDELIGSGEVGWRWGKAPWIKLQFWGFRSRPATSNLPGPPGEARSLLQIRPGIYWESRGGLLAEAWIGIPLAGRMSPADPEGGLSLGYRFRP